MSPIITGTRSIENISRPQYLSRYCALYISIKQLLHYGGVYYTKWTAYRLLPSEAFCSYMVYLRPKLNYPPPCCSPTQQQFRYIKPPPPRGPITQTLPESLHTMSCPFCRQYIRVPLFTRIVYQSRLQSTEASGWPPEAKGCQCFPSLQ